MRCLILLAALLDLGASLPAPAEKPIFVIGAIADTQYADAPDNGERRYRGAPDKLKTAVADLNARDLAFVVHLGDFIDRDWSSYDALLPIARRLVHPWHFVLGNHEYAIDDAHKPMVPSKLGMPARYYGFTRQGWLFLVTDGTDLSSFGWPRGSAGEKRSLEAHAALYADKPLWDGGIGDAQMRWIDDQLTRADRKGLKVMLFNHFPLYPENPHNLWNAPAVTALLERHPSAKIWVDGHNHDGNYGMRAGIHYVNLKAMLDTTETSYARLEFFRDHVLIRGTGREPDRDLKIRDTPAS